jgi:hypothetical protein
MLRLYEPVAATVVLILGLTFWESVYSDRFSGSGITAEEFGKQFVKIPMTVGPWQGATQEVDKKTLEVAGAVNHVSRKYTNATTGASVDLWLVVGHARDIGRHTPDICYPSHGFAQDGDILRQRIEIPGEEPATFYTARFRNEAALGGGAVQRVFWAWNPNRPDEPQWIAPEGQRRYFANNPALYKMYFTANMKDRDEPVAENMAVEFAKAMLPEINRALFPDRYPAVEPSAEKKPGDASAAGNAAAPAGAATAGEKAAIDAPAPATTGE